MGVGAGHSNAAQVSRARNKQATIKGYGVGVHLFESKL